MQAIGSKPDSRELRPLFEAILTDITASRTALLTLATSVDTLAAKLNADAGVTDTNYSTGNAAAVTAAAPTTFTLKS